jgi:hypothetical protein
VERLMPPLSIDVIPDDLVSTDLLSADLGQQMHETNSRLALWLENLSAQGARPDLPQRALSPQQMSWLLSELKVAGERLRGLPTERDSRLEEELSAYRENVEHLRVLLPSIYTSLLQERARLEQERVRVVSAAEWARRSRQTL